jgi:aldose sugar dehydrogenase
MSSYFCEMLLFAILALLIIPIIPIILSQYTYHYFFHLALARIPKFRGDVIIHDPNLTAEIVAQGLRSPSTMAFLGPNDILVLEKNNGTVQRIVNGKMLPGPLLHVNVANKIERGMLGIAVAKHENGPTYVFLSYTETKVEGSDICPSPNRCLPGHDPLGNRLYRYELVNNKLVNPKLLLDLPAVPGPAHNGGKILIGPDNNVYFTIGDVGYRSKMQNFPNGPDSNGTSAIYRITQDGNAVKGIISNKDPLDKYYAYGIRNSFGIDFDPVSGKLWDTENGPSFGDEINLVEPGFNSGWRKVQGFWETKGFRPGNMTLNPTGLEDFGGIGKYRSPGFVWLNTSGPTAVKFLNSDKLGKQYQNDMFVGDYHGGNVYHFKLNQNRTALLLNGPLADKIENMPQELQSIKFAEGFRGVTDLQVSPYDGYLYVVSLAQGKIYKIVPAISNSTQNH